MNPYSFSHIYFIAKGRFCRQVLTLYLWRAQIAELGNRVSLLYFVCLDCLSVRLSVRTTVRTSVRHHDRRYNHSLHERLIVQHRKT